MFSLQRHYHLSTTFCHCRDFLLRQCSRWTRHLKFESVDIQYSRSFSTFSSWDARQDVLDVVTSDSSEKFCSKAFRWGMGGCVNQMRYIVGVSFFWNLSSRVNLYIGIAAFFNKYFMNRSFDTDYFGQNISKRLLTIDSIGERWNVEERSRIFRNSKLRCSEVVQVAKLFKVNEHFPDSET